LNGNELEVAITIAIGEAAIIDRQADAQAVLDICATSLASLM